jgi:Skp family chaperone for outer membrane proteins
MKRSWLTGLLTGLTVCLAALAFGRSIWAQGGATAPTGRIACVNVVHVLNEYQRQKDLVEELSALQERLSNEDQQRRGKLDTLKAELDRLDPDDPTLVGRLRELRAMTVDYKNWTDLAQLNTAQEYSVWTVRMYKELVKVTEELARREGYDLVLYRGELQPASMDPEAIKEQIRGLQVLYANPAVDISQAVLDKLNTDYRAQPRTPMIQTQ